MNRREKEEHVQRSVGLQREQGALGWKLKMSRELIRCQYLVCARRGL